jgi:hypothetical protein
MAVLTVEAVVSAALTEVIVRYLKRTKIAQQFNVG